MSGQLLGHPLFLRLVPLLGHLRPPHRHIARVWSSAAVVNVDEEDVVFDEDNLYGERADNWYSSGQAPVQTPGFGPDGKLHSLPLVNLWNIMRKQLQDYFDNTWTLTETLFGALQGEQAFHTKPRHNLRHPLIFYFGHPASVYVNKCRCAERTCQ
jgi:hypothetical protein